MPHKETNVEPMENWTRWTERARADSSACTLSLPGRTPALNDLFSTSNGLGCA